MGTLYKQEPRNYRHVGLDSIIDEIETIKQVAKDSNITFDQALRVFEFKENERRNDLFVENGDIWDEQIGDIGVCLDKLSAHVALLVDNLSQTE